MTFMSPGRLQLKKDVFMQIFKSFGSKLFWYVPSQVMQSTSTLPLIDVEWYHPISMLSINWFSFSLILVVWLILDTYKVSMSNLSKFKHRVNGRNTYSKFNFKPFHKKEFKFRLSYTHVCHIIVWKYRLTRNLDLGMERIGVLIYCVA